MFKDIPFLNFKSIDENTAEIDISGIIGETFFEEGISEIQIREKLKDFQNIGKDKLIVNIDSPGGFVDTALVIHDLLKMYPGHVTTNIYGMTASAATIIAMAGDKKRISDNALALIHNASGMAMGDKTILAAQAENLEVIDKRLANIYSKATGNKRSYILELMNHANGMGKWMDAKTWKKNGFADEVFEPMRAAAVISQEVLNRLHLPIINKEKVMDEKTIVQKVIEGIKDIFKAKPENAKPEISAEIVETITAQVAAQFAEAKNEMTSQLTAKDAQIQALETKLAAFVAQPTQTPGSHEASPEGTPEQTETFWDFAANKINKAQTKNHRVPHGQGLKEAVV